LAGLQCLQSASCSSHSRTPEIPPGTKWLTKCQTLVRFENVLQYVILFSEKEVRKSVADCYFVQWNLSVTLQSASVCHPIFRQRSKKKCGWLLLLPVKLKCHIAHVYSLQSINIISVTLGYMNIWGVQFGLRIRWAHHLAIPRLFVWFVEWDELTHHHLISHKLIISISMRDGLMLNHLI
jgi:hypothetical protein